MTNLRCTADHHAVPPLNIRPVESGIIPDHFQPVEKLIPLTRTSQSGPDQPPLYFRPTYALPDQSPLIADPSIFSERERAGVDRVSGVNGPLAFYISWSGFNQTINHHKGVNTGGPVSVSEWIKCGRGPVIKEIFFCQTPLLRLIHHAFLNQSEKQCQ